MKNIAEWKKVFEDSDYTENDYIAMLKNTVEQIDFLEKIYMGDKRAKSDTPYFSEEFRNAATKERNALCQRSSACYSVLRDKYKNDNPIYRGEKISV